MSTNIQETINRLRKLDRTASPAPWHWAEVDFPEDYSTTETGFEMLAGRNAKRIIPPLKDSEIDHDAILLTTARNAIPALLAEIDRLQSAEKALKERFTLILNKCRSRRRDLIRRARDEAWEEAWEEGYTEGLLSGRLLERTGVELPYKNPYEEDKK